MANALVCSPDRPPVRAFASTCGHSEIFSAASNAPIASPTDDFVSLASQSAAERCPRCFHAAESAARLAANILIVEARFTMAVASRTTASASDVNSSCASKASVNAVNSVNSVRKPAKVAMRTTLLGEHLCVHFNICDFFHCSLR